MKREELKDLVKKYFNLTEKQEETVESTEQKFDSARLVDGTMITNGMDEDFAPGQVLHVITEDGTEVVAPSGEHTTESGIVIVVDGEGMITGVHHPDQEGEGSMMPEEMASEETQTEESVEEVAMAEGEPMDMEAIIDAIMAEVAPRMEAMENKLAEYESKMKEYMSKPASSTVTTKAFAAVSNKNNKGYSISEPKKVVNQKRYDAFLSKLTN
jgi:hypothetical protein